MGSFFHPKMKDAFCEEEFTRFMAFRKEYGDFRRGNAHGARGELSDGATRAVVKRDGDSEGSIHSSDQSPRSPGSRTADYSSALEELVIGMFQPPSTNHHKASFGQEAELQTRLTNVEAEFLNDERVMTESVALEEIADRFKKSRVPNQVGDVNTYISGFIQNAVHDSVHCNAPKMIGHMTMSLPFFTRPLSKLVTAMHQNNVKTETAKTTTFIEREALAMLHRQIYECDDAFYGEHSQNAGSALGLVTSGGTLANVSAMWLARNTCLGPDGDKFAGIESQGIMKAMRHYGYDDYCIIGSSVLHYSMKKATDLLGMGTAGMRTVEYDGNFQVNLEAMEAEILKAKSENICVISLVGVAGGTETGSIDDLAGIAALAAKYKIHFHVDAAWGGPCIFSRTHKKLLKGIELAQTVTLDGHKQLYTPMGCGVCLVKDPTHIQFIQKTANYIIRKESHDSGKFTLEGSRPATAVYLHANLEILGVEGYEVLIDRSISMVRYMADVITAGETTELVVDPMTNILLYRHLPRDLVEAANAKTLTEEQNDRVDAWNVRLQNEQKDAGNTFVSRTTIRSPVYKRMVVGLRVVLANPLTTKQDVDENIADQMAIAKQLAAEA